jgi:hypothetical protein
VEQPMKGELFLEDQITGWNSIISEKSQVQESCNHENADEDGLLPMAQMMRTENEDRVVAVQWRILNDEWLNWSWVLMSWVSNRLRDLDNRCIQ